MEPAEAAPLNPVSPSGNSPKSKSKSRKSRPSASAYVVRLELPPEKRSMVAELASRFEGKAFVPTIGDVRDFFLFYEIDGGRLKSRSGAMVRIFKVLASMEESEIKRILDDQLFSGPARMEPIADAIRRAPYRSPYRFRGGREMIE